MTDIKVQVLFSVISIIVIAWLYSQSDDILGASSYGVGAAPFYSAVLLRMKASLETAPEEELPQLKKELDEIIFYQKIKRAKRR